jgi:hypothetical protein
VADRVHVLGFVPLAELADAVAAVDLSLNLRYPTAGETSASLLRVLAAGRPALVSDHAQFAELPAQAVAKVALGQGEAEAIARAAADLLARPERRAALAAAAREHVRREHDPGRAAAAIVEACRDWAEVEPPGDRPAAVPPPTSLTWRDLPGSMRVEGGEAPWREGERRRLRVEVRNEGFARWLAAERGPGGMALEVRVEGGEAPRLPWLPLARDVPAGESARFAFEVRRSLGDARLLLALRVVGGPEAETACCEVPLEGGRRAALT